MSVRALDGVYRQSAVARSRRFKGIGKQPSPFRPLYSCKVGRKKILCVPPRSSCFGRRITIVAKARRRIRATNATT